MIPTLEARGWKVLERAGAATLADLDEVGWMGVLFSNQQLVVAFGALVDEAVGRASATWAGKHLARGPHDLVFDAIRVNGYSSDARLGWQEGVWPHRENIRRVALVSDRRLHRLGITMFGMALSVETSVFADLDEYLAHLAARPEPGPEDPDRG